MGCAYIYGRSGSRQSDRRGSTFFIDTLRDETGYPVSWGNSYAHTVNNADGTKSLRADAKASIASFGFNNEIGDLQIKFSQLWDGVKKVKAAYDNYLKEIKC